MKLHIKIIAIILMLKIFQSADAFNWKFNPSSWNVIERIKQIIPSINKTYLKSFLTHKSAIVCVAAGFTLYGLSRIFKSKKRSNSNRQNLSKTKPPEKKPAYKKLSAQLQKTIRNFQRTDLKLSFSNKYKGIVDFTDAPNRPKYPKRIFQFSPNG